MVNRVPAYREQRIISQFVHLFGCHPITFIREDVGGYELLECWQLARYSVIHGVRVGLELEQEFCKPLDPLFPLCAMERNESTI